MVSINFGELLLQSIYLHVQCSCRIGNRIRQKPRLDLSGQLVTMADTPTSGVTMIEQRVQPGTQGQDLHLGSSSDTDVEAEIADEERGKDFIQKRLTLTFQDVSVRVTAPDEALGETLWSRVDPRQLKGLFGSNPRPRRVRNSRSRQWNAITLTRQDHLTQGDRTSTSRGNGM